MESTQSILVISDFEKTCFMTKKRRLNLIGQPSFIPAGYEGIPEILFLNIFVAITVILIFSVLRKKAWHYGRLALLHRKRSISYLKYFGYNVFARITHSVQPGNVVISATLTSTTSASASIDTQESADPDVFSAPSKEVKPAEVVKEASKIVEPSQFTKSIVESEQERTKKDDRMTKFLYNDQGWFNWIKLMFTLTDDLIAYKCGVDSIYYTMFQRRIIVYMLIISVLANSILLPIYMTGTTNGTSTLPENFYFAHTTIANLAYDSGLLWIHCALLILFNLICVFFLRNFVTYLPATKEENVMASIMIGNLDKTTIGRTDLIRSYFEQAYPRYEIKHVKFAYNVKALLACQVKLKNALGALKAAKKDKKNPVMRVRRCSKEKIPCTEYYEKQAQEYSEQFNELKENAEKSPLPICFVSFAEINHSLQVLKDFNRTACGPVVFVRRVLAKTKLDSQIRPDQWTLVQAPDPDDIQWENLAVKYWYFRYIALNVCVFLLVFFLTTPSYALLLLDRLSQSEEFQWFRSISIISDGIAIVLLLTFACLLPYLVSYAEYLCNYSTRSYENLMIMRKVTLFLLFMVLIFPSVSVPSANTLTLSVFNPLYINSTVFWGCIFVPQNGAFFTSYIISASFASLAMEFLRLSGLINYGVRRLFSRSRFERFQATWATVWAFPFGDNYAWMLLIFSIAIVYGLYFPLILPAGLTYFVFKYFVDRYNLIFAYIPNKISKEQHIAAMNFVLFSFILAQFVLVLYLGLNISFSSFKTFFMLVVFMFSSCGFIWHMVYGWIWYKINFSKGYMLCEGVSSSGGEPIRKHRSGSTSKKTLPSAQPYY